MSCCLSVNLKMNAQSYIHLPTGDWLAEVLANLARYLNSTSSILLTIYTCIKLRRSRNCFFHLSFGLLSFVFVTQLRYADKHIVNIMKVYFDRIP